MTIWALLSLAGSGVAVGFLSGLVGIGGGVLIVPLLYFFYGHSGWSGVVVSTDLQVVIAHATSLFVITPTAALGTWTFHRARAVDWRAALPIAASSVVAALAGAQLAPSIPGPTLKVGFGALLLVAGGRLARPGGAPSREGHPHLAVAALAGLVVGFFSALLGVGGGIVAIPIRVYLVGLRMERVAATSMAIIVLTALAGLVGYALAGAGEAGRPPGSLGYVHLLAGLPILLGALLAVPLGARANQRLDARRLRRIFAVLFVVMGVRLIVANLGS